jgi:hypothetical protein
MASPRTWTICGLSGGVTLTGALATGAQINWPFMIASLVLGAVLIVVTGMPATKDTGPDGTPQPTNSLLAGLIAGTLSLLLANYLEVAFGAALGIATGGTLELADPAVFAAFLMGTSVAMQLVKIPFDIVMGVVIVNNARSWWKVLLVVAAVFLVGDVAVVWVTGFGSGRSLADLLLVFALRIAYTAVAMLIGFGLARLIGLLARAFAARRGGSPVTTSTAPSGAEGSTNG